MSVPSEKLRAIFSASGWTRFIDTLAGYRDNGRQLPATVTLSAPSDEERRHLARLLRLPTTSSAGALRYDLAKITAALATAQLSADWSELLTILRGPIKAEKLEAQFIRSSWQAFWPRALAVVDQYPFPAHHDWIESLRHDGTLKRLSKSDASLALEWVERGARLLRALPLDEEQPLAGVAAHFGGNSHALDPAFPLSTLVLRGLVMQLGRAMPSRSEERRELWGIFRVVCDELSAPALTFNLGLGGEELISRLVALATDEKQPLHLTTRMLWGTDWSRVTFPPAVFVFENPTVISMAVAQFGLKCPPMICVDGEPKSATRLLLRRLREGGSILFYHGDFDWPGIAIATRVFDEFGAQSWCFNSEHYIGASERQGRPLTGKPLATPWCPGLGETMQRVGIAYDEELIADLFFGQFGRGI